MSTSVKQLRRQMRGLELIKNGCAVLGWAVSKKALKELAEGTPGLLIGQRIFIESAEELLYGESKEEADEA